MFGRFETAYDGKSMTVPSSMASLDLRLTTENRDMALDGEW